jgi:hypothetical protein
MTSAIRRRDQRPHSRGVALLAVVLGVLLSSVTVLTATRAAFSSDTSNEGNAISTGNVELVDDDAGSALFNITGMIPGQSETACIEVTYQGSVPDPGLVVLYSGGFADSGTLAQTLQLAVEQGTGGEFGDCTGFSGSQIFSGTLADFDVTHTGYGNGVGTWNPSSTPESRTYRFTITLPSTADNSAQGQSITDLVFTWEVQS